jgi:outer membrane protein assembly factor BamB
LGSTKPTGTYKTVWEVEVTGNGNVLYKADPTYSLSPASYEIGIIGRPSLVIASIPNARFVASQPVVTPGLTVSFDGTPSKDYEATGTIVSWAWDFGDNTAASGSKIDHTFATPGTYTVKLTVTDAQGYSDDFVAQVKVSDPPVADPVAVTTDEDTPATVHLHATDPNLDPLTYVIVTQPAHGTLTQGGPDVLYTPAANYFGPDSFTYKANDGRVDGNTATVSITVNSVNDAPSATRDVLPLNASGGATTIDPLANDFDVEGDAFSITSFTQPARGSVVRQGDTFAYTPAKSFQGFDTFTYTITDAKGASSTGEVAVASGVAVLDGDWTTYGASAAHTGAFAGFVGAAEPIDGWTTSAGTGAGPVAVGGGRVYVTSQDAAGLRLRALDPASGQVLWTHTFAAGNSLNPPTYYNGRVYLQRGNHSSDTQLFAIDAATGDTIWSAPFSAQWESYYAPAVNENGIWIDGGYYGGMYGFRHDGSQIAFVGLAQYDDWTPSILGDSIYSYVAGNLSKYSPNGSLQWTHTKTWNWSGWSMNTLSALSGNRGFVNGQPNLYAVNLDSGTTAWTVTGNFSGTPAVAGSVVYAISGNSLNAYAAADGSPVKTYAADTALQQQPIVTDDAIFVASASKTYIFNRASGTLAYTLPYGGTIALANNRLYVNTPGGLLHTYAFARSDNAWPVAGPDSATTAEDTAVDVNVVANDSDPDGDPVKLRAVSTPAHGTATLVGTDSIHYVPAKDYFGTDTFTYTVVDEKGGKATGTVTVTVTPVDDPPVAKPVTIYVPTTGPTPILLGGTDIDGDVLTVEVTSPPLQGTLGTPDADGKVLYTPKPGFTGSDNFYYVVKDATNRSAEALVTVYVDDAPAAVDGSAAAREDVPSSIALNGTDPNGDPLTYKIVSGPLHGSATINGRFLTYTPALNYYGPDRVTFKVNDGIMDSANVATLAIDVQNKNDAPLANADSFAAPPGLPVASPDLLTNDTDVDNDPLKITAFTQPAHGVVSLLDNGRVTYQSTAGYQGLDAFTYTVSDGQDGSSTTTVSISVGTPALAGDWTTFGNNPAHTGYFPGTLLGGSLVQKWNVVVTGNQTLNQVAVADGRVYLTPYTYFGDTYAAALDAATGQQVWKHTFTSAYSINPPTYANGRVYVQRGDHGSDSQLWALDAATGSTAWSAPFQAQWERYMAPVVADGGIFVNGGYYGGLYGFNQSDGSQRFFVSKSQVDGWTPTYANGKLYTSVGGVFTQHNPTTGAVEWSLNLSGSTVSSIASDRAFLTGSSLTAVNLTTQAVAWQAAGPFAGVPAVAKGVVYAVSGSQVRTFDARTGAAGKTFTADATITSQQPIVTDDALIVSAASATYVFHLASGQLLQRIDRGGALTLADGTLYIAGAGGAITSYAVKSPASAPSAPDLVPASDTGESDSDDLTADATPTLTGAATAGATVTLLDGGRTIGTAVADANGVWSITPTAPLTDGVHHLTATVLDAQGASGLSAALDLTVDATAPTATASYVRGQAGSAAAAAGGTVSVQFSEAVRFSPAAAAAASGIGVRNLTTGQDLAGVTSTYDAATATLVITLGSNALADGNYALTIPTGLLTDAAGNALDGDGDAQSGGDFTFAFYELAGDANRDRVVNFSDLLVLAKNYNGTGKTWADGDFTGDGVVNFADLLILARNYNKTLPAAATAANAAFAAEPIDAPALAASFGLAAPEVSARPAQPSVPSAPKPSPKPPPKPAAPPKVTKPTSRPVMPAKVMKPAPKSTAQARPTRPAAAPKPAKTTASGKSAVGSVAANPVPILTTVPAPTPPPVFSVKKIASKPSEVLA